MPSSATPWPKSVWEMAEALMRARPPPSRARRPSRPSLHATEAGSALLDLSLQLPGDEVGAPAVVIVRALSLTGMVQLVRQQLEVDLAHLDEPSFVPGQRRVPLRVHQIGRVPAASTPRGASPPSAPRRCPARSTGSGPVAAGGLVPEAAQDSASTSIGTPFTVQVPASATGAGAERARAPPAPSPQPSRTSPSRTPAPHHDLIPAASRSDAEERSRRGAGGARRCPDAPRAQCSSADSPPGRSGLAAVPLGMARVLVGTSGFLYQHWRDVLYPRGLGRGAGSGGTPAASPRSS